MSAWHLQGIVDVGGLFLAFACVAMLEEVVLVLEGQLQVMFL